MWLSVLSTTRVTVGSKKVEISTGLFYNRNETSRPIMYRLLNEALKSMRIHQFSSEVHMQFIVPIVRKIG
ncbi:hypothetical protein ACS0PU_008391 [Formica fusca]